VSGDDASDLIVVGAGAAGILAAIFAARRGARVLLLETRPVPGAKIRVSGGGRANVLPSRVALDDFHTSGSRAALRNILFSWPLEEVRSFFEEDLGVRLKTEATGKVFPVSDDAREVVRALLAGCERSGATLLGGRRVASIEVEDGSGGRLFRVAADEGDVFRARRVVLATGGLSLPKTGSDGGGLAVAQSLGHSVAPTYPALVPLLAADPVWGSLAGISLPVRLRVREGGKVVEEREGDFLFTHRGFSGPVALDVSWRFTRPGGEDARLEAAWLGPAAPTWDALLREPGKRGVAAIVRGRLPRRLADRLVALAGVPEGRVTSELTREERSRLVGALEACPLEVAGNEGYAVAEVTGGGVPLEEVSPRTLESRIVPGLHLCGEILDATGRIGGYNFLWAWVTGRKAGEGAAAREARNDGTMDGTG
jgi:predicted Rossmann fold flavoprotein